MCQSTLFFYVFLYQEVLQSFASGWMSQFSECFCLDLADTFSCNVEFFSYFFQGSCPSIFQSKSQVYYLALTVGQRFQRSTQFCPQHGKCRRIRWRQCRIIFDEIAARWLSSSSPMGVSSETGSLEIFSTSRTLCHRHIQAALPLLPGSVPVPAPAAGFWSYAESC